MFYQHLQFEKVSQVLLKKNDELANENEAKKQEIQKLLTEKEELVELHSTETEFLKVVTELENNQRSSQEEKNPEVGTIFKFTNIGLKLVGSNQTTGRINRRNTNETSSN